MPQYRQLPIKSFNPKEGLKKLFRLSGIYFLVHRGEIDYVGRSVNIGNRLMSHHVFDRNYHDSILVYEVPQEQMGDFSKRLFLAIKGNDGLSYLFESF